MRPKAVKSEAVKLGLEPDRLGPSYVQQWMSGLYSLYDLEHTANAPDDGWSPANPDPFPSPRCPTTQKVVPELAKAVANVTRQLTVIQRRDRSEKQVGGLGKSAVFTQERARLYRDSILDDMRLTPGEESALLSPKCMVATREHFDATFGANVGNRGDNSRLLTYPDIYHERHEYHSGLGPGELPVSYRRYAAIPLNRLQQDVLKRLIRGPSITE
jgi:hypothetical protein